MIVGEILEAERVLAIHADMFMPAGARRKGMSGSFQKLVGWLKLMENSNARQEADSPMAAYDLSWMWDELGIADLRR